MILLIAEKPSVAKAIAPCVGAVRRSKTAIEGNGYIISWCVGHLVGLKSPDEYNNGWQGRWNFQQLPMVPQQWRFRIAENTREQFNALKEYMNHSDVEKIICATDADREGECIFRYVYNLIGSNKPVERLWISSLEESAIRKALNEMQPMSAYDNLFAAGFSRARADWLVGMNGSRLFSVRYGDTLNIGRVQTPTLAMIVKRDAEVANLVPKKTYTVDVENGYVLSSKKMDDQSQAQMLAARLQGQTVTITDVKRENGVTNPPKLFDLTTLQREANVIFGYSAQQTTDYLQSLYEGQFTTYPRTDSQYLPEDMRQTAAELVGMINQFYEMGFTDSPNFDRIINNAKVTGHHAILPTTKMTTDEFTNLPVGEKNILGLIANRLILAVAEPQRFETVKVTAVCDGIEFKASGKTITQPGWKAYATNKKDDDKEIKALPGIQVGDSFTANAKTTEHNAAPPKHFTEDTLLSAMEHAGQDEYDEDTEKKGLGTPATRAATIEGLIHHGFCKRDGKKILATEKGVNLIAVVPDEVKSPKLTADWEMKLQQIERGQYSAERFMQEIEEFVKGLCNKYATIDESVQFKVGKFAPLGRCPHCQADVIDAKYGPFCTAKCGMNVCKVYGQALTAEQVNSLLNGKGVTLQTNGKATHVYPEIIENEYNGKTYYQWVTKKGK